MSHTYQAWTGSWHSVSGLVNLDPAGRERSPIPHTLTDVNSEPPLFHFPFTCCPFSHPALFSEP